MLTELNSDFEKNLLSKAREIRKNTAKKTCIEFLENFDKENEKEKIENSFLNEILQRNAFDNCLELLSFSKFVTRSCVDYILDSNHTILEKISLVGYVVELGAKEFISPYDNRVVKKNLSSVKQRGYFFTPVSLAYEMALKGVSNGNIRSILDPACGVGTLLAICLVINPKIEKVTGIEIDFFTTEITKKLLQVVSEELGIEVKIDIRNENFIDLVSGDTFNDDNNLMADLVIMNPPYGRIRFLESSLTDNTTLSRLTEEEKENLSTHLKQKTKNSASILRKKFSDIGLGKGTPELSKIFLGSTTKFLLRKGKIVAITPSSWLGDIHGTELRKYLLENFSIEEIWTFREDASLFKGVNQPTSVVVIQQGDSTNSIELKSNLSSIEDLKKKSDQISLKDIQTISPNYLQIPQSGGDKLKVLLKLHAYNKFLKDVKYIVNLRGELDQSFNKDLFKEDSTFQRLIRGDHIEKFRLKNTDESEKIGFVDGDAFKGRLGKSEKLSHITQKRIVVPQCSYLQQKKRVEACVIPENSIVGNSCNYLLIDKELVNNDLEILEMLCVIMNSSVIEWRFRIFNSNNHIANYEIDELPIVDISALPTNISNEILKLYRNYSLSPQKNGYALEAIVAILYKLEPNELSFILEDLKYEEVEINEITKLFHYYRESIDNDNKDIPVTNHTVPTLSDLDLEMIKHVPQGGNWMDIPESVPSKRLEQIREQSKKRGIVRTTYYGRLKPTQPAYTISTYFNRPGNGTNIHPWENRTLTCREAARLQSFPDSFNFYGSEGAVRTQIGNAVPPLLAYSVGKTLGEMTFVDLFAGAGGLSYGLELAGLKGIAALEQNKSAVETYKNNHSKDMMVVEGDITDENLRTEFVDSIKDKLNGQRLGLLAGGPPCQGFSTAGWRSKDDKRNVLVNYFFDIAQELKPKNILIENVEGILNYDKGNVVASIQEVLGELGYITFDEPWVLNAEEYGVPQMRRRVFILATLKEDISVNLPLKPKPFFDKCKGRRETETDRLNPVISYPVTVAEAFNGLPELLPSSKEEMSINNFYNDWCQGKISTEAFLNCRGGQNSSVEEQQLALF